MKPNETPMLALPWKLPVPSTSLVQSPHLRTETKDELVWSYEGDSEFARDRRPGIITQRLTFVGVLAFRCTYGLLCGHELIEATYDKLVDLGKTDWLETLRRRVEGLRMAQSAPLRHMAIFFDEGACYEFICKAVYLSEEFSAR